MKKVISVICIVLLSVKMMAQDSLSKDIVYTPDKDIDKFIGTWLWKSGDSSLLFVLKKEEKVKLVPTMNVQIDIIYGFHKYIRDGVIIEDSLPYINTAYKEKKSTLLGSSDNANPNVLTGGITHLSKDKSVKYEIQYLDNDHIKIIKIYDYEGFRVNSPGTKPYDTSISLPQNIVLVKQQ
ncbi:DUF6705 family protein [Elizabethkingia meningoseptica]|uniref:DUF6705 family protein n=1 Tax=Elizabethkingia meningoseptica TaxID=238 RepID=UPI0023B19981|nr:DUF6705 family protein [Elizabethkingia meningoseptica]MDE5429496.1 hypothetical protein [Elizabethkingia meningoseptica]